jgi:hypothetical protein
MPEKFKPAGCELFEQALKSYDQAFQAGLAAQEEVMKGLLDCAAKMQAPEDWQKRWSATVMESLPLAQKRMEESLQMVEQCSRTSLDFLKQAFEAGKIENGGGVQAKVQELWEASLQTLRTNAQAFTQFNAKAVEAWVQYVQKSVEPPPAVPKAKAA